MSKQFALTSARIAFASDNVLAPLSKDEIVVDGVAPLLSHVDAICAHVRADHTLRQQHVQCASSTAPLTSVSVTSASDSSQPLTHTDVSASCTDDIRA